MPVTSVKSRWSSGSLIFHEDGNLGDAANLLTISTSAVTVGNASNDVDFIVYCSSNTFKIDSGAGTMTFTGDVEITGDVDVSTEDIAVDQGKYIYLDGLAGSEHIYSNAVGKITITASGTGADDITLAGTVTAGDNITMTSGKYVYFRGTTEHIVSGSANNLTITAGTTVNVAAILSVSDTTEASAVGTASVTTAGGLGVTKKLYVGTDLVMVGGDIDLSTGSTGTYDIILKDSVADALSIRRASTDVIVFNTTTPSVTITPATTISGALTCSAAISCDDTTDSSSTVTGSVHTDGGLGVAKKVYVGTDLNVAGTANLDSTTEASAIGTAGVVCDGGVSVAKKLYVGGDINVANTAIDLIVKANTDSALELYDSTTKMLDVDTRNTVTAVSNFTMTAAPSTITAASGVTKCLLTLTPGTTTLTGSTGVTAMEGLGLYVNQPTVTDEDAVTVTTASTVYIANAPTGAGSGPATLTNAYALHVDAGETVLGGKCTFGAGGGASCQALLAGAGSSGSKVGNAASAGNFLEFRLSDTATSGMSRGLYMRLYRDAAGTATGEAIRSYLTVNEAVGNACSTHMSLDWGASGAITGSAAAATTTLHIYNGATAAGTQWGHNVQIHSDGSSSDISGTTAHAILSIQATGDATGADTVLNAMAFSSTGTNSGSSGYMIYAHDHAAGNAAGSIRVLVDEGSGYVAHYLKYWDAE